MRFLLKNGITKLLRNILYPQAKGKEYLLPLNDFPEEIDLDLEWHKILNLMRDKTGKDQIERVALVPFNLTHRAIYLPTERIAAIPWQWERNAPVAQAAIDIQKASARQKGAEGFVGVLHSHPPHDIGVLNFKLKTGRLSAGDLYLALRGNSFAFRTRESISPRDSHDTFYDLWERDPQPWNLDRVIAEKYKLALYKGNKNGVLKQISPRK